MNITGWHRLFRRGRSDHSSPFTGVLPRVRTIREHCDWPSATTPASREHRRERLLHAQRRSVYRLIPRGTVPESAPPSTRIPWLWLAGPLVVLCAVVWALWTAEPTQRHESRWREFTYQLPAVPPFLSEQLALTKAQEALSQVIPDPAIWRLVPNQDRKGSTAPDGTRDVHLNRYAPNAGIILFDRSQHSTVWAVNLQLDGAHLYCTVMRLK